MSIPQHMVSSFICFVVACLIAPESQADSARFTLIDAREGMTAEVISAYQDAMGSSAETPIIRRRVKVIASSRFGFAPETVALPDTARLVDIDVTLLLQRNSPRTAPINLNQMSLARRVPHRIRQTSHIIGY